MTTLFNYQILQKLGTSMHSEIFKVSAPDKPNEIKVLRKIKAPFNSANVKEYLEQQIEQQSNLPLTQSTHPTIIQPDNDNFFLIQDFITDYSLTDWLQQQQQGFNIEHILTVAISLVHSLGDLHKAGHIHKGLKPNNVLLDPDTLIVQIIDNIRVLDINQLSHFIYDAQFCQHTLPYLAPEQTEKIKYSVNYNTDLYAIGIIIYEALTGTPPFSFDDPVTILHSHLAATPQRVESINPQIPVILGDIVEQLLQKAPEKRYQTASGLKADLEQCLSQWQTKQAINSFNLKRHDFSNQITIPSIMVGRNTEKQHMLQEFEKSASGYFRSALISGYSGIGKTRLIQELQLPIVSNHGYFCAGKFDQFQKHIPYSTLVQAFTHLIKTYLTEDDERQQYWRDLIQKTLGNNARLITDLIPELELIIGKPAALPHLPPVEARNRFNDTMGLFITCLANKKHPLTLFIDDLQWCDSASFDVLEYIFTNASDYPYLFWIGAYRHNEVDNTHRLTYLIEKAQQLQRPLLQIRLETLTLKDVNEMTAYILNTYASRTEALAKVIFNTSMGNPLFVNESLRWLHSYQHLHLNEDGFWAWDDEQLRHTHIPETARDLFKDKIQKLPLSLQKILGIAAILGARFEAEDLALTVNMTMPELNHALAEAFLQNILLRDNQQIVFFHDQVQAAAERLIDDEHKQKIHDQIATALIKTIPADCAYEKLDNLFAIVQHLDAAGSAKASNPATCSQEAALYYAAGIASMDSLAIDSAYYYFQLAQNMSNDKDWTHNYTFIFSLYKYLARTEMALGHQDAAENTLEIVIQRSNNHLDRADCLYEQAISLSSLGQFKKAIKTGNRGLDYFNRRIPDDNALAMQKIEQLSAQFHQPNRDIWQEILTIKPSHDRALLIEVGICGDILPDYYLAGMLNQCFLAAFQAVENCLLGGIDENASISFALVGLFLQTQGRYDLSLRYENLALTFAERYPNTFGAMRGMSALLWFISHNHKTAEAMIERCQHNIDRGKRCGDLFHVGIDFGPYLWYLILQGKDMQKIHNLAIECNSFSNRYNLSLSLGLGKSTLMGWSSLMQTHIPHYSSQKIAKTLALWQKDMHIVSIGTYYILAGMAHYYLGDTHKSVENIDKAEPCLISLTDNSLNRLWFVFRYLNIVQKTDITQQEHAILDDCLQRVSTWADLGVMYQPYLALMIAEQAFHTDDFNLARSHYLAAIDSSYQQGYTFLEAFSQQRLGELHLKHQHRNAESYLQHALLGYQQCGADIKAQQLITRYALITSETAPANDEYASLGQLQDIQYLLAASQQITQALDLNTLLSTIMKAIMQRLGVQNGFLLIAENQNLTLFAKAEKKDDVEVLIESVNSSDTSTLSMAIVNYVFRIEESILLNNAHHEGDFITDKTVIEQQLKSILCLPLIKQQKVLGVLYLENHLVADIFTVEQIEQTKLLTTQASIALHNVLLMTEMQTNYDKIEHFNKTLEQRVAKRTQALNEVNEELKNFAYVVSHDLKAPLRAINQLSAWIEEDYAEAFGEEGREQMSLLRGRAKRMHDMIEGILQYSRIGRTKIIYETIDLNVLFADIVNTVVPPEHIKLVVQPDLPTLTADKIRLFQVIQNLLDNAIKYNDKKEGVIQFSCEANEQHWQFSLQDNGQGIAKEHQQKVFQLFHTLAAKDTTDSTGVGLSLIEKSITNWGGKISLQSEVGKGCKFSFTLPKNRKNNNYE